MMQFGIIFMAVLVGEAIADVVMMSCISFNGTENNVTFPTLALSFSTLIEGRIMARNRNFVLREYFDYTGNRFAREMNNTKHIVDYNMKERRIINITNGINKCIRVTKLPDERHRFGLTFTEHVPSTADIIHFGKKYGEKYMGKVTVRNRRCIRWQSCMNTNHSSYLIDYYFTDEVNSVPVRCEVKGTHSVVNSTNRDVHNVYDYFDFKTGPPPLDVFRAPPGTLCNNVVKQLSIPQLPDQVSYSLEYHTSHSFGYQVRNSKIFYDYKNEVFRSDHLAPNEDGEWAQVKEIHNNKQRVKYKVYSPYDCEISKLIDPETDRLEYVDDHINMKMALHHMKTHNSKYSYEGTAVIRNMEANVWIFGINTTEKSHFNRIEWYFSRNNFAIATDTGNRSHGFPLKVIGYYGNVTNVQFTVDIFHFDTEWDDETILNPTRHCLQLESSLYPLTFFLDGLPKDKSEALTKPSDLAETLLNSFAEIANVTTDRLAVELIITTNIFVRLSVLGWPLKDVERPKNFTKAVVIAAKIESAVATANITVDFANPETRMNYTGTLKQTFIDEEPISTMRCGKSKSHTVGIVLGIIFSFLVGLVFMLLVIQFMVRRNGHSLKKLMNVYGRFGKKEDDTTTATEMPNTSTTSAEDNPAP